MTDLTQFLACWPATLAQECPYPNDWANPANFSNDPYDPGGATMDGIIQSEYSAYCAQHDLPQQSVKNILQPQGQDIYVNNFWLPYCPLMPVGLNLQLFDSNVNEGVREGIRILQVALGVTNDGIWGPQTQDAVDGIANLQGVISAFTARRKVVYQETSGYARFGTDWIRRATQIGNEASLIAGGHPTARLMLPNTLRHVPRASWYIKGGVA